jgi:nucleotidyltransferase substrate binding protein (TIGR01987 family)
MDKKEALKNDLKKAVETLIEAVDLPENAINRDASIQRFEYTFELSWKLMQVVVNEQIPNTYGPRNVIREAARLGYIEDPEVWFEFLKKRNLAAHTYNEDLAKEVYSTAKDFPQLVKSFLSSLQ